VGALANDDAFQVQGSFILGDGSNGIDPLSEAVTLPKIEPQGPWPRHLARCRTYTDLEAIFMLVRPILTLF
jgi:hypothetical protein